MTSDPYLRPVFTARQRMQFHCLIVVWLATLAIFWAWWLNPTHVVELSTYLISSIVVAWWLFLPGYFFFFLARMYQPRPDLPIPASLRVAMIVTKAPSEPWAVVQGTLLAMLAQPRPHDTWLADEDPTPETFGWCAERGVRVSTRRGISAYHRPTWPRRTRSKEGNLAYFYDTNGYAAYDVVVQLDADHRPAFGYLDAMLRPFADPGVGYVTAPSVCDGNTARSWAARARLYVEATLHGSLQAGYNHGWAPLCIGSHYAIRTAALREIGGLGPELAEDHSTTLLLNAAGWHGVHAMDAEAHGDGPLTFADCMTQEFQWARSLGAILFTVTPGCWRRLSPRLRAQFLFTQLWYPLFGMMMLLAYLVPLFALATHHAWVNVSYPVFLLLGLLCSASALLIVGWVRSCGWMRPPETPLISWEAIAYQMARWPWVLLGSLTSVLDVLARKPFAFRVTPKGAKTSPALPIRVLAPYLVLIALSGAGAIAVNEAGEAVGYYYFAILNSVVYAAVAALIIAMHGHETARD